MDEFIADLVDDMLAKGWTNDPDPDRSLAYINVSGNRLIVCPKGERVRFFEIKEIY